MPNLKVLCALARPRQFAKQLVVLLPVLAVSPDLEVQALARGALAVISFACVATTVYIVNDLFDAKRDRAHESTRYRPIAAGAVSRRCALIMAAVALIAGILITCLSAALPLQAVLLLATYLLLNFLYSKFQLRNQPLMGIALVAVGFPLRFQFGVYSIGVETSWWALVLLMELAMFMLSGKRFQRQESDTPRRSVHDFWLLATVIFAGTFISTYLAFAGNAQTQTFWGGATFLLIALIPVSLGVVRYLELVLLRSGRDGTERVVTDPVTLALGAAVVVLLGIGRMVGTS